jgi:hypothetical protein
MRKRILIVNAFFDEYRRTGGSPFRVPRAMGPVYLAGAFSPESCEVRLYSEQYRGALRDCRLLAWPDMLVLTGVTSSFDRMLQLTAYARALNPRLIVVAGGPPVRALPRRAARFFDYACSGDIEQLLDVVRDAFGPAYVAERMFPRYDLADPARLLGYVESSRHCNFRCRFCSLTGEGNRYLKYDLAFVRCQIRAVGKKQIVFIDNNFYGNDRRYFLERIALLRELHQSGEINGWSALVTGDFFKRPDNLALAREAGCRALFSGVESFDAETLTSYNKRQNTVVPQVEMIRNCLEAGILFNYGIMLDPSARRLDELRREIGFIVDTPEITLPAFFSLAIPLIGTPYFDDCLRKGLILPSARLRHFDGVTLALRPLDPLAEVVEFARDLPSLHGFRKQAVRHAAAFTRRYRGALDRLQLYAATLSAALICTETFATSPARLLARRARQTYVATTETLDPQYTPMFRLESRYETHFRPTMVTDPAGGLAEDVAEDLSAPSLSAAS